MTLIRIMYLFCSKIPPGCGFDGHLLRSHSEDVSRRNEMFGYLYKQFCISKAPTSYSKKAEAKG